MIDDFEIVAWGIAYVELGWRIFPCDANKRPLTRHGVKDAGRNANYVRYWWNKFPKAQIGLACGQESGVIVVDIDCKNGVDGLASFRRLTGGKTYILTPTAETPTGGRHLFFRAPPGQIVRNSASKIAPGVDVRADGGYAVLSPGRGRSWFGSLDPWSISLAPLPSWIPTEDTEPRPPSPGVALPAPYVFHDADGVVCSRYGEASLRKACWRIESAPNGSQNQTLNDESYGMGQLCAGSEVSAGVALACLQSAADAMTSYNPRAPWTRAQTRKIIDRGFRDGLRSPRSAPERSAA